jgi:hypothetical protein
MYAGGHSSISMHRLKSTARITDASNSFLLRRISKADFFHLATINRTIPAGQIKLYTVKIATHTMATAVCANLKSIVI